MLLIYIFTKTLMLNVSTQCSQTTDLFWCQNSQSVKHPTIVTTALLNCLWFCLGTLLRLEKILIWFKEKLQNHHLSPTLTKALLLPKPQTGPWLWIWSLLWQSNASYTLHPRQPPSDNSDTVSQSYSSYTQKNIASEHNLARNEIFCICCCSLFIWKHNF